MKQDDTNRFLGLACITDKYGTVEHIIRNDIEFTRKLEKGSPLAAIIEESSIQKLLTFFLKVREEKALYDWNINVKTENSIKDLYFVGGFVNDQIMIVASSSKTDASYYYEEVMRMNNEQTDVLRSSLKEESKLQQTGRVSESTYRELTKLNNELTNLQRDLFKKNAQLQKLIDDKNYLIGMAAHDLRNPLGGIYSMCGIILEGDCGPVTEEQQEYLSTIRETAGHMLGIVTDMLEINKIEAGKLELYTSTFNVVELMQKVLSINKPRASKKDISIAFSPEQDEVTIEADPGKLQQVMDNLISNAVKFSYSDSSIVVALHNDDSTVAIEVTDHGMGISAEDQSKLFQPFSKLSNAGTHGESSTGLGLAITKQIVEGHGGTISVKSEKGEGSTFTITLPKQQKLQ
jgi:two-component system, OmpR family, sensor kinase